MPGTTASATARRPSLKPLASWVTDLHTRLAFFEAWLAKGTPHEFWLPAFFQPHAFLASALQRVCRGPGIRLSDACMQLVYELRKVACSQDRARESEAWLEEQQLTWARAPPAEDVLLAVRSRSDVHAEQWEACRKLSLLRRASQAARLCSCFLASAMPLEVAAAGGALCGFALAVVVAAVTGRLGRRGF